MPCSFCKSEVKKIAAKGLCRTCYSRLQRAGTLEYTKWGVHHTCTMPGCTSQVVAQGLCDTHYCRLKRHGSPNFGERADDWGERHVHPLYKTWTALRRRTTVRVHDDWKDFWAFVGDVGAKPEGSVFLYPIDAHSPIGPKNFQWKSKGRLSPKEWNKAWRDGTAERRKQLNLWKSFRLSLEQYSAMLERQGNTCAICKRPERVIDRRTQKPRALAVDHCHITGAVRGLLCTFCNQGIGHFNDDTQRMRAAIEYLEKAALTHSAACGIVAVPRAEVQSNEQAES